MNESGTDKDGGQGVGSGGAVVALPVAPMNGYDAMTVRVPSRLVEVLRQMKPNTEFALAVTILVDEAMTWAQQQQAAARALAENALLKQKLGELILERWERDAAAKVTTVGVTDAD